MPAPFRPPEPTPDDLQRRILEARRAAPTNHPFPQDVPYAQDLGGPPAWGMTPEEREESRGRMLERNDTPIQPPTWDPVDGLGAPMLQSLLAGAGRMAMRGVGKQVARQVSPAPDLPPLPPPEPFYVKPDAPPAWYDMTPPKSSKSFLNEPLDPLPPAGHVDAAAEPIRTGAESPLAKRKAAAPVPAPVPAPPPAAASSADTFIGSEAADIARRMDPDLTMQGNLASSHYDALQETARLMGIDPRQRGWRDELSKGAQARGMELPLELPHPFWLGQDKRPLVANPQRVAGKSTNPGGR